MENYFEIIEKYKASIAEMKRTVKVQVVESSKFRDLYDISVGTLTVEKYRERGAGSR